jgi:hypothetical protein
MTSNNTNALKKMNSETIELKFNNNQLKKFSLDKIEEESNIKSTTLYRSLSSNIPINFVPHIKPKKSNIKPSPMLLNLKSDILFNKNYDKLDNLNEISASLEDENFSFSSSDLSDEEENNNFNNNSDNNLENNIKNNSETNVDNDKNLKINKESYKNISFIRKSMNKIKSKSNNIKYKEAEENIKSNFKLNNIEIKGLNEKELDFNNTNYNKIEFYRKNSYQNKGNSILNILQLTCIKKNELCQNNL